MKNSQPITLETGHVYWILSSTRPPFQQEKNAHLNFELDLWKKIERYLFDQWYTIDRVWFHDDVIPRISQKESLDSWRWELYIQRTRSVVLNQLKESTIWNISIQGEYELISAAIYESIPQIINSTHENQDWSHNLESNELKWPRIRVDWKRKKQQQKIRLMWYAGYNNIPSCEVLDYTLYNKRLEQSPLTITLIHEDMKTQQSKVHTFFEIQWIKPEIIVLFHNGENICSWEYWWAGKHQKISDQLLQENWC